MNARERILTALNNGIPDRLPVVTHHVMPSFKKKYLNDCSNLEFFGQFNFDPINWVVAHKPDESKGEFYDPTQGEVGFLEARRICTDNWRIQIEQLPGHKIPTQRFNIITPEKTMSMVLQTDQYSTWVSEHLIKEKADIDIIAKYVTHPKSDNEVINNEVEIFGDKGIVRSHICCFDGFGQPGTWQDLACIFGIEPLIMATFEDPEWVHTALGVLFDRKLTYIQSMKGANYDLLELGGGDASTTVISPDIFDEFVAPYDSKLIEAAHEAGQKIVYHTCGGMMPILENIAAMNPDAMETFTPPKMGGDVDIAEAKKRIGDKVCMIGGFDQLNFLTNCSPAETRKEVRRLFEAAGQGGGYILAPSDHFFDAEPELLGALTNEAEKCVY